MSSIVAFTFGSFGDIATILQLGSNLVAALRAASSASDEIDEIVTVIATFTGTLEAVNSSLVKLEAARHPAAVTARTLIREPLDVSGRLLQRMTELIAKHRRRIERQYGRRRWKRYWAACIWYLIGGKATADSLRRQLSEQQLALNLMLTITNNLCSTAMMEVVVQGGTNAIRGALNAAESPSIGVKAQGAPFVFFDYEDKGVMPMLNIPWREFTDLCSQFVFFGNKYAELELGRKHKQTIYSSNGRMAWFEVYIYQEPIEPDPIVLISPVFHILGKSNTSRRPAAGSSRSEGAMAPASVRFLAFTAKYDTVFEDARVSLTLTKLIEYGYKWLKASRKQPRNNARARALDAENGRRLRLTISRVIDDDYRCNLATAKASHVVAIGTDYFGF